MSSKNTPMIAKNSSQICSEGRAGESREMEQLSDKLRLRTQRMSCRENERMRECQNYQTERAKRAKLTTLGSYRQLPPFPLSPPPHLLPTPSPPLALQFLQAILSPVHVVSHTAAQIIGAYGSVDVENAACPLCYPPCSITSLIQRFK